jgi:hypothetical protein
VRQKPTRSNSIGRAVRNHKHAKLTLDPFLIFSHQSLGKGQLVSGCFFSAYVVLWLVFPATVRTDYTVTMDPGLVLVTNALFVGDWLRRVGGLAAGLMSENINTMQPQDFASLRT